MNRIAFVVLVLWCSMLCSVKCGLLDYTEFDDPISYFWGQPRTSALLALNTGRECSATGATVSGVCQLRRECLRLGGTPRGLCGLWTVCCTYANTCGVTTSSKVSYFNSGPQPRLTSPVQPCRYTVALTNNYICQMRIDFLQLTLAPASSKPLPTPQQVCADDVLTIDGTLMQVPKICGENSGQHVYVPVNATEGVNSVSINIHLATRATDPLPTPAWNIKITQLECPGALPVGHLHAKHSQAMVDFPQLAPQGCLQYFTEPTGYIRSFGFLLGSNQNRYVVDQKYAICFKRSSSTCGIRFAPTSFDIFLAVAPPLDNICSDYLFFPEMAYTGITSAAVAKLCGTIADTARITSTTPGPLYVNFIADGETIGAELGFELGYEVLSTGC